MLEKAHITPSLRRVPKFRGFSEFGREVLRDMQQKTPLVRPEQHGTDTPLEGRLFLLVFMKKKRQRNSASVRSCLHGGTYKFLHLVQVCNLDQILAFDIATSYKLAAVGACLLLF